MPINCSAALPPRYVANPRAEPSGESFARNPSLVPPSDWLQAPGVAGKSGEVVSPATKAEPFASRAIPLAESQSAPPSRVEYTRELPSGESRTTKASALPGEWWVRLYAPG